MSRARLINFSEGIDELALEILGVMSAREGDPDNLDVYGDHVLFDLPVETLRRIQEWLASESEERAARARADYK